MLLSKKTHRQTFTRTDRNVKQGKLAATKQQIYNSHLIETMWSENAAAAAAEFADIYENSMQSLTHLQNVL